MKLLPFVASQRVQKEVRLRVVANLTQTWSALWKGTPLSSTTVLLLIILHLALTLPLAALLNVWQDEAYSLHTSGQGLWYAVEQALHFELQPPLYFAMLALWRQLSDSIFFARLLSVICAAVTIGVTARISRQFLPSLHPGWLVAAIACNPFLIWAAVEIRVYALAVLLSALSLLWFFEGYLANQPRTRARWGYCVVVLLSLYTQYYLGFLFAAQAGTLLILRRWQSVGSYVWAIGLVALCAVPLLFIVPAQIAAHTTTVQSVPSFLEGICFILGKACDYILPAEWPPLILGRYCLLGGILVATVVWSFSTKHHVVNSGQIALWVVALLLTLFLTGVVMAIGGKDLVGRRHAAGLFLPMILAAFSLLAVAPRKAILGTWLLLSLFFSGTSLYGTYRPMAKLGDWDRVAAYLWASAQPGQPLLLFPADAVLPFQFSYAGSNTVVPLPHEVTFQAYDVRNFTLHHEQEIRAALARVPGETSSVWLVTFELCTLLEVDFGCQVLEDFVAKYYTVEARRDFFGSQVRLLRRKAVDSSP